MSAVLTYAQKTPAQIHDDILRTISNGLIAQNLAQPNPIPNFTPNVGPGSDYDLWAWAVANQIAVGQANDVIKADGHMPDTAVGSDLDRWLAIFGLSRQAGSPSNGNITPTYTSTSTVIPAGAQLVDNAGLRYQVAVGGTYGPLGNAGNYPTQVPIQSIDVGSKTNHVNGDPLRWVTLIPFVTNQVVVGTPSGTDGLTNGQDGEVGVDEPPRLRLFALLQNPPKAGNWNDIALWAVQSSTSVQGAAVYPALLGPATVSFVVWRAPQTIGPFSSTSKNRDVSSTLVTGTIVPFVQGLIPTYAYSVGLSVANQPTDVGLLLSLPSSPQASPAGPGGGWIDGSPWPQSISGTTLVQVTGVTSSTVITVNATTAPTPGVSHIGYIDPVSWQLFTATVLSFTGSSGAYVLTIDTPWPAVQVNYALFPQAVQQQNYMAAMLQGFANLGPGEWTAQTSVIARAFRHPIPSQAWDYFLDAAFLRVVENAGPEVLAASFLFTSATKPNIPANTTTTPPNILTPRYLAWYQQ